MSRCVVSWRPAPAGRSRPSCCRFPDDQHRQRNHAREALGADGCGPGETSGAMLQRVDAPTPPGCCRLMAANSSASSRSRAARLRRPLPGSAFKLEPVVSRMRLFRLVSPPRSKLHIRRSGWYSAWSLLDRHRHRDLHVVTFLPQQPVVMEDELGTGPRPRRPVNPQFHRPARLALRDPARVRLEDLENTFSW